MKEVALQVACFLVIAAAMGWFCWLLWSVNDLGTWGVAGVLGVVTIIAAAMFLYVVGGDAKVKRLEETVKALESEKLELERQLDATRGGAYRGKAT